MIRAGSAGEQEDAALRNGFVTISWNELPDLSKFRTREEVGEIYKKHYKEATPVSEGLKIGQVFRFANRVHKGDWVVLPSKFNPEIHIGEVTGEYHYKGQESDVLHWIPVKWHKTIPRSQFDEDLLYSFGSLLTLSNIKRNNALERVKALVTGKQIQFASQADEDNETGDDTLENAEPVILHLLKLKALFNLNLKIMPWKI
ncbi:MAG: hypothetical protein IPI65_16810 [Bacteroidetes bacterium]|nr:hypothetical protein [Bacteroidota bacterium]